MDWDTKVRDLKRIVNELEMLAQQLEGRQRMLLGRSADELKRFANDLERLLDMDDEDHGMQEALPEWLNVDVSFDDEQPHEEMQD